MTPPSIHPVHPGCGGPSLLLLASVLRNLGSPLKFTAIYFGIPVYGLRRLGRRETGCGGQVIETQLRLVEKAVMGRYALDQSGSEYRSAE